MLLIWIFAALAVATQALATPAFDPRVLLVLGTGPRETWPLCAICGLPSDELNGEGECPGCVEEREEREERD